MFVIFLFTLALAAVNAAEPLVLKYLFDNLTTRPEAKILVSAVIGLLVLGLFRELASGFSNWLTWHTRLNVHYELLEKLVERLHRMPLSFHRTEGVGAIMTRLDRSIQGFIGAISQILFNVFPAVLYLGISIVVMMRLNWQLAALVLCFAPLPAAIAAIAGPEQTRRERNLFDQWSKIYSRFNEVLSGIITVRSFSMEDAEKRRFIYYEHPDRPILEGINLEVKPGQTLAIVGPSGSGKSTLMALLMRFYDPIEGAVRLDGRDLRMVKQKSLRKNIGVVLQDPLLFNDTIRNNIAYARPQATAAEIEEAAKAANAHEFILKLPEGYETMVGERGSRLSVGERQRITIARALIKNPPILILDEATSSLDAESEALVQEALDRLMQGRTTFVIAHRLSTIVHADCIVVLKKGRIVESGNHWHLMQQDGYYTSLVKRQIHGLVRNEGERQSAPVAVAG